MKTKIETIWEQLETDTSFQTGILLRRYAVEVKPDLYVALKAPDRLRCIAFRVKASLNTSLIKADNLREIQVEVKPDEYKKDCKLLLFMLLENRHSDIFAVLCEDLITIVQDISDENLLLKTLLHRFLKWQTLFEKLAQNGLSVKEQQGLFGELYFLHELIENNFNPHFVVQTWVGMLGQAQDFIYQKKWAVEIKTNTIGKGTLAISNEYQLDDSSYENLFLHYLGMEINNKEGLTLPFLINQIISKIQHNNLAVNLFRQKLLDAGYFDSHVSYYDSIFYNILINQFYQVKAGFPRITPSQLYGGVSHVIYEIDLVLCNPFIINQQQVLNTINTYE